MHLMENKIKLCSISQVRTLFRHSSWGLFEDFFLEIKLLFLKLESISYVDFENKDQNIYTHRKFLTRLFIL